MKKYLTLIIVFVAVATFFAFPAFAQDGSTGIGTTAFAAAFCMAIAALGGTAGQSRTAAAALEGIARNPQSAPSVQTPMIIALAMIESLVLFSFVIAFFLQGKI